MNSMNNLPENWRVMPLGEACKTIKGKKPKDSGPASAERTIPYINIKAFESGEPVEFAVPGNYPTCERDDVLVVWDGARAGLTGRAVAGYIGSTLTKIYSELADNRYLFYFLQSQYGRINSRTKGVGIPHVDPVIFNNIPFPIAPPEQQKHIVAEIEKQFSRLDEAVANLKRVKANLKRYKAAVLKAAVEGRLVETEAELARREGRSFETGEQLLHRILETRRSQWKGKGKYKEPATPDTTDLPELPEGWVRASVNQIAEKVVDGTHHTPEYVPEGVPFISVKDVRDSTIYFDDTKYITSSAHDELIKRCHPEVNDVLITKSGTIGRTAVIATDRPFSLFVSVALIKPVKPVVNSKFLQIALDAYIQSIDISQDVKGGLLKNLHLEDLRVVAIPLPPESEQHRIVTEVDRRFSLLRDTEGQVDANLKRAERLRQSTLASAFSGNLLFKEASKEAGIRHAQVRNG